MRRLAALLLLVLLCLQAPALQAAPSCCADCPEALLCATGGPCHACAACALPNAPPLRAAAARPPLAACAPWSVSGVEAQSIWRPPWWHNASR